MQGQFSKPSTILIVLGNRKSKTAPTEVGAVFGCRFLCYYPTMLQDYISTYLKKAKYERIEGGKQFYAEIKPLRGVWATGKTKAECQKNLSSTLEGWIIFRLRRNLQMPYSFRV